MLKIFSRALSVLKENSKKANNNSLLKFKHLLFASSYCLTYHYPHINKYEYIEYFLK